MVMSSYWGLIILAKCSKRWSVWNRPFPRLALRIPAGRRLFFLVAISVIVLTVLAGSLAAVSGGSSKKKTKQTKQTTAPKPKAAGGAGLIAIAQRQLTQGDFATAAQYAKEAAGKAPQLEDYAEYIREQAEYNLKNYSEIGKSAARVFDQKPASPLTGPAAALAVKADLGNDQPKQALDLIRKYYPHISQPQADFLLAQCFRATGDLPQAVEYFQRVYYNYPKAKEAEDASQALSDLKNKLGDAYPPPAATAMLARAKRLLDTKSYAAARSELEAALPSLRGAQLDLARVRIGATRLLDKDPKGALDYLKALHVEDPEADAERLSYIIRSARKLDRTADVRPYLDQLAQQHPDSLWRLDALIVIANQANTDNEPGTFLPLYQACAAGFPTDPRSAWCHWRLAFTAYWQNKPDAFDLLREQVQRYPDSEDANAALYYLGRFSESRGDTAAARAYFSEMARLFPNTYYAVIGRERLKDAKIAASAPDPAVMEFIQSIPFPVRVTSPSFVPDKDTQKRLERAKLLETADLLDWAESELKFGAHNDGEQPQIYAYELAKLAAAQSEPDQAVRYIKAFAPGYLSYSSSAVPLDFWHLAFPMPYRAAMERDSRENELDPFLVAALIRQESEFNARVISYANAYGLMQVMPATGRELARRLKIKSFRTSELLTPDRNMQLGTYYFRSLLNQLNGEAVFALAAYNAGKSRVDQWRQRGTFHEPSEFIETIPFDQTRTYVQVVLRNADVYRRFYAGTQADPTPQKETQSKPAAPAKKTTTPTKKTTHQG
jgi:soluble lytic murein transglycosylase